MAFSSVYAPTNIPCALSLPNPHLDGYEPPLPSLLPPGPSGSYYLTGLGEPVCDPLYPPAWSKDYLQGGEYQPLCKEKEAEKKKKKPPAHSNPPPGTAPS